MNRNIMKDLKIHFINVGYGDAILLEAPCSRENIFRILVDTGSGKKEEYSCDDAHIMVTDYLREKGVEELDILILTHPHEDHIGLAEQLNELIRIRKVIVNFLIPRESWDKESLSSELPEAAFLLDSLAIYGSALKAFSRKNIPVFPIEMVEKKFTPVEGLEIAVLENQKSGGNSYHARLLSSWDKNGNVLIEDFSVREELIDLNREGNSTSLALLFSWRGEKILLTGDSCPDSWNPSLLEDLRNETIQIFKLPHHGQLDSITPEAAEAISPAIVVTSSSSDRRYGSSCPECYRIIREACPVRPLFLFTDEENYEPYFRAPSPFNALILTIVPEGKPEIEFFKSKFEKYGNSRTEVLLDYKNV